MTQEVLATASENSSFETTEEFKKLKQMTLICYILFLASYLLGITGIIGIIICYIKKGEAQGTFLDSHFKWMIKTFWISLGVSIIGFATWIFIIGMFILFGAFIWGLYRFIKGFLLLQDGKPIA